MGNRVGKIGAVKKTSGLTRLLNDRSLRRRSGAAQRCCPVGLGDPSPLHGQAGRCGWHITGGPELSRTKKSLLRSHGERCRLGAVPPHVANDWPVAR